MMNDMSEWKKVRLGDVCRKVYSGGTPKSTIQEYYCGDIPWLNTKEINFNRVYETEKSITQKGYDNSSAKWVDENSVILAMYGATAGKVAVNKIPLTTNQACCNLIIEEHLADYRFVYYSVVNNYKIIASLANGAAQQNLNVGQIKEFEICAPSISTQKCIADILGSLDDKIELNSRINSNLESQAQALFKRWFVDFEFPDANGSPYKSSGGEFIDSELGAIPKGWKVDSLTNIANYLNGLAMQKYRPNNNEKGIPVLKIRELGQKICNSSSDICSENIKKDYIIHNGDVIFSWSGTLMVDLWTGGKCGLNQHLFKVTSNNYPKWFYYMWTNHHLQNFIRIAKDKAVTMGHIKRSHLDESLVLIPTSAMLSQMDNILTPIIDGVINSRIQSGQLIDLRNTLLPKLMNNEMKL